MTYDKKKKNNYTKVATLKTTLRANHVNWYNNETLKFIHALGGLDYMILIIHTKHISWIHMKPCKFLHALEG